MTRPSYLRVLAILLAAIVAAVLLAAMVETKPAEAAFPGTNGKIVFSSSRTTGVDNPEGDAEIFTMNPDGTGIEQLTFNDANDYEPAFSAQGDAMAFTSDRDGNEEIYKIDAAPESATNPAVRLTNNTTSDSSPVWSPDGNKIAFKSHRSTLGTTDIFVMDAKDEINNQTGDPGPDGNGDNLIRLTTNNTKSDNLPAWSPDGSNKIAFTSNRDDNFGEIYVMDAAPESATNIPVRLTNNVVSDFGPNWSPDGSKIAFTRDANPDPGVTNNDIFMMDAVDINPADGNGDNLKRRTKKAAFDSNPVWSPDGKKIAFMSDRGGDFEIFVMKANRLEGKKNRPKNLTKNDVFDSEPDWQPIP